VSFTATWEGAGGRNRENKTSGKRKAEHNPPPVPGLSRPGTFKPQFFKPEGKKPFTTGPFIVFLAPFLIRLEQFPRPDGTPRRLYTTLLDKVPQYVHLIPVFFRGIADKRRGIKPLFKLQLPFLSFYRYSLWLNISLFFFSY
jgi:hypothetical protein